MQHEGNLFRYEVRLSTFCEYNTASSTNWIIISKVPRDQEYHCTEKQPITWMKLWQLYVYNCNTLEYAWTKLQIQYVLHNCFLQLYCGHLTMSRNFQSPRTVPRMIKKRRGKSLWRFRKPLLTAAMVQKDWRGAPVYWMTWRITGIKFLRFSMKKLSPMILSSTNRRVW